MRNGAIDVYKFIFSITIVFYHATDWMPLGSLGVEFFVIVAGVMMLLGYERFKKDNSKKDERLLYPCRYAKKRFWRFFPYSTAAFVIAFCIIRIYRTISQGWEMNVHTILKWLSDDIWEIFLVKMTGLNNDNDFLNGPAWSLSAMLIAEFFILVILVRWEKHFATCIAPLMLMIGFGFWRHIPVAAHELWIGFATFGVLRVVLLYCIAYYCFIIIKKLQKIKFTSTGKRLLTLAEGVCLCMTLVIMRYAESRNFRWCAILFVAIMIVIALSGSSHSMKIFHDSKYTRYLGKISFGIFLVHWPILKLFQYRNPNWTETLLSVIIFFAVILLSAMIFVPCVEWIHRFFARQFSHIKLCMIAETKNK